MQIRPLAILAILTSCTTFSSCTSSSVEKRTPAKPSSKAFHFDHAAVTQMLITRNDAASSQHWSARVEKQKRDNGESVWVIASAPEGRPLIDRLANKNYIEHLLDTLGTLQVFSEAPHGSLESFGLKPPKFGIRWDEKNELLIGDPTPNGAYGVITQAPLDPSQPIVISGATLALLSYLENFESLRQRTITPFSADDVDEFEIKRHGKTSLYAQRNGDAWVDAKEKKLKFDAGAALENLVHLRVSRFVDEAAEAAQARETLAKDAAYEVVFRNRGREINRLRVGWDTASADGKSKTKGFFAVLSSRDPGVFEIFPEALRFFETQPKK